VQSHLRRVFELDGRRVIAIHLTARLRDDGGIARDQSGLRLASRIITQHGEPYGLLAHRIADTHLHALLAASRDDVAMFARYALSALRKRLSIAVPFEPARMRGITSERHLLNGARYLFLQESHHGTSFDLAHDGSSLPELLGLRVEVGQASKRLRRLLPRLSRETVRSWLAVGPFESADPDLGLLCDAAAAAFGVDYSGSAEPIQRALRRAAAHVARELSPVAVVVATLGVTPRAVQRYLLEAVPARELQAVELQLRLRSLLATAPAHW
jgi:hypothetical protein